ncbi:MAG: hypothetical protein ACLRNQ_19290 [Flavonifractor plautii]
MICTPLSPPCSIFSTTAAWPGATAVMRPVPLTVTTSRLESEVQ